MIKKWVVVLNEHFKSHQFKVNIDYKDKMNKFNMKKFTVQVKIQMKNRRKSTLS